MGVVRGLAGRTGGLRRGDVWPNCGWSGNYWPAAGRSWMTHWRSRPSSAGALNASSRNCLSLWPSPLRHLKTTLQSGAYGTG